MSGVLFIGCGPGASGADSVAQALLEHPDVVGLEPVPPRLLAAIAGLVARVADHDGFLPREAGLALRAFCEAVRERLTPPAADALIGPVIDALSEPPVHIEAYGEVPIVRARPTADVIDAVRAGLVALASATGAPTWLVDKHGPSFAHARLSAALEGAGRALHVVRDPLEVASHMLTPTSATTAAEAIALVDVGIRHWLANRVPETIVVRLDVLVDDPAATLRHLAAELSLRQDDAWMTRGAARLPRTLGVANLPAGTLAVLEAGLADVRGSLGYA